MVSVPTIISTDSDDPHGRHKTRPYQISSAIGAGGKGEVYRASEERLGREVAIKGLLVVNGFRVAPDAKHCIRGDLHILSTLFVVSGLK